MNRKSFLTGLLIGVVALTVVFVPIYIQITCMQCINPTTRYYTIPASAWLPSHETYDFYRWLNYLSTSTAGSTSWFAAVNLPHGAVVTELTAWVYDNDAADITVILYSITDWGGIADMVSAVSSGASTSRRSISNSTTIVFSTIDNLNKAYLLWGVMTSGNSNHRLSKVRITYTIDEPLP